MKPNYFSLLFTLLFGLQNIVVQAQSTHIFGPPGSRFFGTSLTVLSNGNFVVTDPSYTEGGLLNIGAVYLYNGSTLALISTLKGSKNNDQIGSNGVTKLVNGNFVVSSPNWDDGAKVNVGAVTWVSGTTGLNGTVNVSNSLIGSTASDQIGNYSTGITALSNGNYVVASSNWDNGVINNAGAVTWGNGTTGISGLVSTANSLVGTKTGDQVGFQVTALNNGNYVVNSGAWDNGLSVDAGAVTWCNGNVGFIGEVSIDNSLVGSTSNDGVGDIKALSNGNYVVTSYNWDNGPIANAGAVTWCNGTTGLVGVIGIANSLIGGSAGDQIGYMPLHFLTNGNYVVKSPYWDNGSVIDAGAVTWGNGAIGTSGLVSAANSLVGSTNDDRVGFYGLTALTNGNYVVESRVWDHGTIVNAGAVTFCNGSTGFSGPINATNSLVGNTANDVIGNQDVTALTNGHYVVNSPYWDNGSVADAGAVTWGDGTSGVSGLVSTTNSLVGTKTDDRVGYSGVTALANGNYVVGSYVWNNFKGAATWCNGTIATSDAVSVANSLTSGPTGSQVGQIITALSNGHYVVGSPGWKQGAATWCDGTMATATAVSTANSLTKNGGYLAGNRITALSNGNYIVFSQWDNGEAIGANAVTWRNGATSGNGIVSAANSLVGYMDYDMVGVPGVTELSNGNYLVHSKLWHNGSLLDAGAITWGSGTQGVSGSINACNSVMGMVRQVGDNLLPVYNETLDYLLVANSRENKVTKFIPGNDLGLAQALDSVSFNIQGNAALPIIAISGCRIIASLQPNGGQPVANTVNAKLWIESTVPTYQGKPFVARHYEITPVTLPSTSTGRVTLYFTQQEFTNYNNDPGSNFDLPTSPDDATGISNIRIGKFSGTSSDRSGLPASYPGDATFQDPTDADIIWNDELQCWAISFNVTGFSGFIVRAEQSALPLDLLLFKGRILNNDAMLNWKTSQEENTAGFRIERSFDGKDFLDLGFVKAKNTTGLHSYNYTDPDIIALNQRVVYYRLKIMDTDSRFRYSEIIALPANQSFKSLIIYPNPVLGAVNFSVTLTEPQQVQARIMDNAGRVVKQQQWNLGKGSTSLTLDLGALSNAIYYLELKGKTIHERKLFIKQ